MESILRTAYYMVNKEKAPQEFYELTAIRGAKDIKEATVDLKEFTLKIAAVSKVSTVRDNYTKLLNYDFIEVMACPGGCIGGGGQPLVAIKDLGEIREKRIESMYAADNNMEIKESYLNPEIQDAYDSYINKNTVKLHTNHDE